MCVQPVIRPRSTTSKEHPCGDKWYKPRASDGTNKNK